MTKADHCQRVMRRHYPPHGAPNNANSNLVRNLHLIFVQRVSKLLIVTLALTIGIT
jgi:hypothetical protein